MGKELAKTHPYSHLTARRAEFLAALAKHGTVRAASRVVATEQQRTNGSDCAAGWFSMKRRDPAFAAECAAAESEFLADLHERARQWAMGELTLPRFTADGAKVADVPVIDNAAARIMLRLLQRHDPDWAEQKKITADVRVTTGDEGGVLKISVADFSLLTEHQQQALTDAIQTIAANKATLVGGEEAALRAAVILSPGDEAVMLAYRAGLGELSPEDALFWKENFAT